MTLTQFQITDRKIDDLDEDIFQTKHAFKEFMRRIGAKFLSGNTLAIVCKEYDDYLFNKNYKLECLKHSLKLNKLKIECLKELKDIGSSNIKKKMTTQISPAPTVPLPALPTCPIQKKIAHFYTEIEKDRKWYVNQVEGGYMDQEQEDGYQWAYKENMENIKKLKKDLKSKKLREQLVVAHPNCKVGEVLRLSKWLDTKDKSGYKVQGIHTMKVKILKFTKKTVVVECLEVQNNKKENVKFTLKIENYWNNRQIQCWYFLKDMIKGSAMDYHDM